VTETLLSLHKCDHLDHHRHP